MNKLLCEVLSMCNFISRRSKADVFFDYAPHCNSYSVFYYRDGWTEYAAGEMVWMNSVTKITQKNLRATLAKLNALAIEMGAM